MNSELFINVSSSETVIALLHNKRLMELGREKSDAGFFVADIFLGKVKKIMPGLNAAFVDIGYDKDAFLHYLDLGPNILSLIKFSAETMSGKNSAPLLSDFSFEKEIVKTGKINNVLKQNQSVPVQIMKEPISNKGPRLTADISFAGRFMVLIPFSDKISISQKIVRLEERERLRRLVQSIKPKNFSVIIRTAAEHKTVAELDADIRGLLEKWEKFRQTLKDASPPQVLLGEMDRAMTILRDKINPSFTNIYVNNQKLFEKIKTYLNTIAPAQENIVKYYKGKESLFEHFGIDKQIKASFGRTVSLKSGAYLIIEHTEAMQVIDVNSGSRTYSNPDQESHAIAVNTEATDEIARQLRLRDIGGIIVCDFIDMRNPNNRKTLYEKMKSAMAHDPATHTILPLSKFGLLQITRERVRPQVKEKTTEKCPACGGSGEVQSTILLIDQMENDLGYLIRQQNQKNITLYVHPFIEAYLTKGFLNHKHKWFLKYRRRIHLKSNSHYHILEYRFFNKDEEEIRI